VRRLLVDRLLPGARRRPRTRPVVPVVVLDHQGGLGRLPACRVALFTIRPREPPSGLFRGAAVEISIEH
jgi:hypothetical protein